MIKVEVLKGDKESSLYFSSSNNSREDIDTLDEILKLVVGPFPRRGTFPLSGTTQQNATLKIDVHNGE